MELLTKDQLWRVMLRAEPSKKAPKYFWGALLFWFCESANPMLIFSMLVVFVIGGVIGTMFAACYLWGVIP
jgi:hypothetical protein